MDYLTKNPFPQLKLIDMKDVYDRQLSQLDQRFLEQNENKQKENKQKENKQKENKQKDNSDEDFEEKDNKKQNDKQEVDKKTPEEIKKEDQIFREERKKQYKKIDNIDQNKKVQYFEIKQSSHCDPYLRKHFIDDQHEIYRGFQPQDIIPLQIQEKCYTLKYNCCSVEEINYLDDRSYELIKKLQEQKKYLKKILIKIRSIQYEDLNEEFKQKQNEFKSCMKNDLYEFDLSLKDLFSYLYQYEDDYNNYIDFLTHRIYDFNCSFCNAEDTDFFLYSHARNMYVNTAQVPQAIVQFYNMYNKVQKFYKLFAFSNFMYCFKRNSVFQDYNRRHISYQNHQDVEQFQKLDKNKLLKEDELMNYFSQNYFPGTVYIPNFQDSFEVLKLALDQEDEQQIDEHKISTYEFLIIENVLQVQQSYQDDFQLDPKNQIILLNTNDGLYERKMKYDARKIPHIEEYDNIYILSILIYLIFIDQFNFIIFNERYTIYKFLSQKIKKVIYIIKENIRQIKSNKQIEQYKLD